MLDRSEGERGTGRWEPAEEPVETKAEPEPDDVTQTEETVTEPAEVGAAADASRTRARIPRRGPEDGSAAPAEAAPPTPADEETPRDTLF